MYPRSVRTAGEQMDYRRVPKRILWDVAVDLAAQLYGATRFEDLVKDNRVSAGRRKKILAHLQRTCAKHASRRLSS